MRSDWLKASVALLVLFLTACSGSPGGGDGGGESCTNGLDDDGNGKVDCQDPACATRAHCLSGEKDAGTEYPVACTSQIECLPTSYFYDAPLSACVGGQCRVNPQDIRIRFDVGVAAYTGVSLRDRTLNTRFVLKKAVDGSDVSCETVKAVATSSMSEKASQIEDSKKFNLLAFDVSPISMEPQASVITQPSLVTGIGGNFLIWTEIWSAKPNPDTKLPAGVRLGWGCFESGAAVEELKREHHWPPGESPTATSRTLRVNMPAPNG